MVSKNHIDLPEFDEKSLYLFRSLADLLKMESQNVGLRFWKKKWGMMAIYWKNHVAGECLC
jgi:hypothetical protein